MFLKDQKAIEEFARASPDNTARVLMFVSATIHQYLFTVPEIVKDFVLYNTESRFAFGVKSLTLAWLESGDNKGSLFRMAEFWRSCETSTEVVIRDLTTIPGLGIVKAGFLSQLLLGRGGCIDTHNARIYDVDLKWFSLSKKTSQSLKERKIKEYIQVCESIGSSHHLWDEWCAFVADKYPTKFRDAEDVSKLHVYAITQEI